MDRVVRKDPFYIILFSQNKMMMQAGSSAAIIARRRFPEKVCSDSLLKSLNNFYHFFHASVIPLLLLLLCLSPPPWLAARKTRDESREEKAQTYQTRTFHASLSQKSRGDACMLHDLSIGKTKFPKTQQVRPKRESFVSSHSFLQVLRHALRVA